MLEEFSIKYALFTFSKCKLSIFVSHPPRLILSPFYINKREKAKIQKLNQKCQHIPVILALRRWEEVRQETLKFGASLG
jgi:hypothetical protein